MSYIFKEKKSKTFIYSRKGSFYIKNIINAKASDEKKIIRNFSKTIRLKYKNILISICYLIIIYFFFFSICIECNKRKLQSEFSIIKLKTKGTGLVTIISKSYKFNEPNEIYINDTNSSLIRRNYTFQENGDNINNFTLIWRDAPTSCNFMFTSCDKIIEIDLSNCNMSSVTNMAYMFSECSSLTSIDITNVNTEKVTTIAGLFKSCTSLQFMNLSSFNTQSLTNIKQLFEGCLSLTSVDFSGFNTTSITSMNSLFKNCISLKYLNLSNFNTPKLETMSQAFSNCSSLTWVDLSNLDTSEIKNMDSLFFSCLSLENIYLQKVALNGKVNLSSIFNIAYQNLTFCSGDEDLSSLFPDNKYVDCNNGDISKSFKKFKCYMNNSLADDSSYTCDICGVNFYRKYNETIDGNNNIKCYNTPEGYYLDENVSLYKECYSTCKTCEREGNETLHNCLLCKNIYRTELNELNYSNCYEYSLTTNVITVSTYHSELPVNEIINSTYHYEYSQSYETTGNFFSSAAVNEIVDSTYHYELTESNIITSNYISNVPVNERIDTTYISELPSSDLIKKTENSDLPGNIITNTYHSDLSENIIVTSNYHSELSLNEKNESSEFSKLSETDIIHNSYISGIIKSHDLDNIHYSQFELGNIISESYHQELTNVKSQKDIFINTVSNSQDKNNDIPEPNFKTDNMTELIHIIINNLFRELNLSDIDNGVDKKKAEKNILVILTSTLNQKNNENTNNITMNLGQCEKELKEDYNISNNDSLYILQIISEEEGMKIPKVEYEIYYPLYCRSNLTKLDLSSCKDTKIEITYSVKINDTIDKHNASSDYYNDLCSKTTSESGTDISLKDRRNEFVDNNMTLCQENCDLIDYNYTKEKAKCSCDVKLSPPENYDIKFDKNDFFKSFIKINNIANINILKCYDTVLQPKSLLNNYGCFIISSIIFLYFITLTVFASVSYIKVKNDINNLFSYLKNIEVTKMQPIGKNIEMKKNNQETHEKHSPPKKKNNIQKNVLKPGIKNNNKESKRILQPKSKIMKKNITKNIDKNLKKIKQDKNVPKNYSKQTTQNIDEQSINQLNVKDLKQKITNKEFKDFVDTKDFELNSLDYEEAIKLDHRSFLEYYFSLIKYNHPLLFSFATYNDYNSRMIKIFLFFFAFSLDFSVNALFFSDDTMHKIYEDKGKFNFLYQIPQILYSTLISKFIDTLIKNLALSQENIVELKQQEVKNLDNKYLRKLLKNLKIKFIFFFITAFLILSAFWYYVTCFCGIYENTQMHLINDSLIGLGTGLLYPFGFCLIPGIFRIPSLRVEKPNRECLYKFSGFLENYLC